jgi:hypothetical protein
MAQEGASRALTSTAKQLSDCAATTAPVHTKNVAIMGWSALNDRTFSTYFRENERRRVELSLRTAPL